MYQYYLYETILVAKEREDKQRKKWKIVESDHVETTIIDLTC